MDDKEWLIYTDLIEKDKDARSLEMELCKRDPLHWLYTWCWTLDSHDPIHKIKRFPEKKYIRKITELWLTEERLLIEKSRQMMISWWFMALNLWDCMFHEGRLSIIQSKKEKDANKLILRAWFIFKRLPNWMKPKHNFTYCNLIFPEIESEILGIPQGEDTARMHTASRFTMDEMAFQTQAEGAYTAAKPTIDGGGKFLGVSSANPSFFELLVNDKI